MFFQVGSQRAIERKKEEREGEKWKRGGEREREK